MSTVSAEACFRAVLSSSRSGEGRRGVAEKAFTDLDWGIICGAIAAQCAGRDAEELAGDLGLLPTIEIARRRLAECDEATTAQTRGVAPPLQGFDALGDALLRARKHDVLSGSDLLRVQRCAAAARRVRGWATADALPLLTEHAARLSNVQEVDAEISRCIDPAGEVSDAASPELGALRRRVTRLRDGIRSRLERIVKSPKFEGILQDDYVTIRDERYVLPVRAGERGDFPGIVHGQSASGQTLFIEPRELIDANNDLRMAQLEVENEERRILTALSGVVRRRADELEANQDILIYLDLTFAIARVCDTLDARPASLQGGDRPSFEMPAARHPVLALRDAAGELRVIGNDIGLDGRAALIVSGPNTGGKTVTLKTVGLAALFARAGVPFPVGDDATLPWFEQLFTDIGDEQGVDRDLSTFSGHVANIVGFLDDVGPGSLVLLDELFAGTDPQQGAALGRALLETLVQRGATVVVTTHLEGLKTLGMEDDRFRVASVGFDIETLRPTYVLRGGVPGSSYALRIATSLGMSEGIVGRAREVLDGSETEAREDAIERLEREHDRLRLLADEAQAARDASREEAERARAARERANARAKEAIDADVAALRAELKALRGEARQRMRELRRLETPESAEQVEALRRRVEEARAAANRASSAVEGHTFGAAPRGASSASFVPEEGARAYVSTFKRDGEVLEVDAEAGRAVVQIGPLRTNVSLSDLAPARDGEASGAGGAEGRAATVRVDVARSESNTVDLRGERVDEALDRLDAFLDQAARTGGALFVIHGHGTGALKRAVRDHLGRTPYPLDWRPGENGEGGDGVTVVVLGGAPGAD